MVAQENVLRQGIHLLLGRLHLYMAGAGPLSDEELDLIEQLLAFHQDQQEKTGAKLVTHDGRTMSISAWAREIGVERQSLLNRLRRGWSPERALETPFRRYNRVV